MGLSIPKEYRSSSMTDEPASPRAHQHTARPPVKRDDSVFSQLCERAVLRDPQCVKQSESMCVSYFRAGRSVGVKLAPSTITPDCNYISDTAVVSDIDVSASSFTRKPHGYDVDAMCREWHISACAACAQRCQEGLCGEVPNKVSVVLHICQ